MLCSLDIPILFVDSPVEGIKEALAADCIYPKSQPSIRNFVREMDSHAMCHSAAYLMTSRIKEPSLYSRTVYTHASLIYRESTGDTI